MRSTAPSTTWPTAGRWFSAVSLLATALAVFLLVVLAAPGRILLALSLAGALVCSSGAMLVVVLSPALRSVDGAIDHDAPEAEADLPPRVGTLMFLGGVPDELARMTSAVATGTGPVTLVVPAERDTPVGLDAGVVLHEEAHGDLQDAIEDLCARCDAVLVCSARAMPTAAVISAAGSIEGTIGWVQGEVEPLNRDRFGPVARERLDSGLRRLATRAGLHTWESDGTVIDSGLLAGHSIRPGRPFGSWLRERSAEGRTGAVVHDVVARRAAPVAAEGYWPETSARQGAAAADAASAATARPMSARARASALGLLVHTLSGWSVVFWLASLAMLVDGSPVSRSPWMVLSSFAVALASRWIALRLAVPTGGSAVAGAVAALYALPGSLRATRAAVTGRVRRSPRAVSSRPLAWFALVATALAAGVILSAEPGDPAGRIASALAAVMLLLLWVFSVRSLLERSWRRVGFRVPMDLSARLASASPDPGGADPGSADPGSADPGSPDSGSQGPPEARVIEGSPGGLALLAPPMGLDEGDEVTVSLEVDGRRAADLIELHGTVVGRRGSGEGSEVLALQLRSTTPAGWAEALAAAAAEPSGEEPEAAGLEAAERPESGWGDRVLVGMVLVVTLAVVGVLALAMVGVRPLVIRSGSMEPTYSAGDVVFVASETVGDVEPGQVLTRFDAPQALDSLTHRVVEVTSEGRMVRVVTRGDANESSEVWQADADTEVGVVVASVPGIGVPFTRFRSTTAWAVALGVVVVAVVALLLRPRRSSGPRPGASLNTNEVRPTVGTGNTTGDAP